MYCVPSILHGALQLQLFLTELTIQNIIPFTTATKCTIVVRIIFTNNYLCDKDGRLYSVGYYFQLF